jgi:hypothetical protein
LHVLLMFCMPFRVLDLFDQFGLPERQQSVERAQRAPEPMPGSKCQYSVLL